MKDHNLTNQIKVLASILNKGPGACFPFSAAKIIVCAVSYLFLRCLFPLLQSLIKPMLGLPTLIFFLIIAPLSVSL